MKHEILVSAPPIIRDFLTYNESIKGKSSNSIDEYYLDLQTFFRYIKQSRGMVDKNVEFSDISRFYGRVAKGRKRTLARL